MIKELLIGLMVFAVVTVVLFSSANDVNNSIPGSTPINSSYSGVDYGYKEVGGLMGNISDNAPGGNGSTFDTSSSTFADVKQGYRTGSLIFRSGSIFKKIVEGNNVNSTTNIASTFFIRNEFMVLVIASIILIVALILISSLLLNPIR